MVQDNNDQAQAQTFNLGGCPWQFPKQLYAHQPFIYFLFPKNSFDFFHIFSFVSYNSSILLYMKIGNSW